MNLSLIAYKNQLMIKLKVLVIQEKLTGKQPEVITSFGLRKIYQRYAGYIGKERLIVSNQTYTFTHHKKKSLRNYLNIKEKILQLILRLIPTLVILLFLVFVLPTLMITIAYLLYGLYQFGVTIIH